MAEAPEATPNESAVPSSGPPRRKHAINLCCARSVQGVVEEVARHLEGLGFSVTVVFGAEARAALLSSRSDRPTIHVVCVQGSLQERVLKPLRQALATHGGPNHHLFVAVLDVEVPLAMVGQIRRFAEALERSTPPRKPSPTDRPTGPQPPQRDLDSAARSRASMQPSGAHEAIKRGRLRRRGKGLSSRGQAAKISGTSKYKAVTAGHRVVPSGNATPRPRRRTISRLNPGPLAPPPRRKPSAAAPAAPSRATPPPPPAAGKIPRRRQTSSRHAAVPPPPPKGKLSSSTSIPAVGGPSAPPKASPGPTLETAVTTHHKPWKDGKPPADLAEKPAKPSPAKPDEADRVIPRGKGFRFTPPGVKAAEVRAKDEGLGSVPAAEVLEPVDRTLVQGGMIEEVPRTATTLRLDEPPFSEPTREDKTVLFSRDEPAPPKAERTVITAPPKAPPTPKIAASEPERTQVTRTPDSVDVDGQTMPRVRKRTPSKPPGPEGPEQVSETSKTLRRLGSGGTAPPPSAGDEHPPGDTGARSLIELDPEDQVDTGEGTPQPKPKKTILYGDAITPDTEGTQVAEAPAAPVDEEAETRDTRTVGGDSPDSSDDVVGSIDEEAETRDSFKLPPRRSKSGTTGTEPSPKRASPAAESARSSRAWVFVVVLLLLGGGGFAAYQAGLLDGVLGKAPVVARGNDAKALAGADSANPAGAGSGDADSATPAAVDGSGGDTGGPATGVESVDATTAGAGTGGSTTGAGETGAATTGAETGESTTGTEPVDATTTGTEPDDTTTGAEPADDTTTGAEPAGDTTTGAEPASDTTATEPPAGDGPRLTPEEQILAKAVERRELIMLKTLFTSRRQGEATTWNGGNKRCRDFQVDGVKGWRLPHRREMKLLNAVLPLAKGLYWTKTVPPEDRQAAYMLDTSNGSLDLFLKQEPTGEVLCVRRREHPGK